MNLQRIGALILGLALLCHISEAQELTVSAAADLQFAMQDIAARFEKQSGKQIDQQVPFDVDKNTGWPQPTPREQSGTA